MPANPRGVVALALAALVLSGPALAWTPERALSRGTGDVAEPRIVSSAGLLHVFWRARNPTQSIFWDLRYTRSADGGRSWSRPVVLAQPHSASVIEVDVAADGLDVHVVWRLIQPYESVFYKRSNDGGLTWSRRKRLSKRQELRVNEAPQIAVSGDNVFVTWTTARTRSRRHKGILRRSFKGGVRWMPRRKLPFARYRTRISSQGSRLHLVYRAEDGIYHRRSPDYGDSWSPRTLLPTVFALSDSLVSEGDSVHFSWTETAYKAGWVWYLRSPDRGATWIDARRMHRRGLYGSQSSLAVLGDDIHLSWLEGWGSPPGRIFYRHSTDEGRTWLPRERLAGRYCRGGPAITVGPDGAVHAVYVGNGRVRYRRSR
jgi:hypothetical protein